MSAAPGRLRRTEGFTLIELALVLAILGILAAFGASKYLDFIERARAVKSIVDIEAYAAEIAAYEIATGALPTSLLDLQLAPTLDPWGRSYEYLRIAGGKSSKIRKDKFLVPLNTRFDLYSRGKDGLTAAPIGALVSLDDVIRANDGAYVGLASRY